MKKETIVSIIGLLLLMLITAGNVLGEPLAGNPEDLTEICSDRTLQAKEGDSLTFCKMDLSVTAVDESTIKINDKAINMGQTGQFDSLEVSYESFLDGTATVSLSMIFEKKLESKFEENRFKLFYDDIHEHDAKFAGPADASREAIAEMTYRTNKAKITIRSATRELLMLGIDFENEDGTVTEKLNIPFSMERTTIKALKSDEINSNPEQPELFDWELDEGTIKLTLGESEYQVSLDKTSLDNGAAIKISSDKQFVLPGNGASAQKQTKTLWISTKLARSAPEDLSCSYDTTGSSIDDFTTKARVQGLYPASPSFFDVFTDYCIDENTLANYGCVGLKESSSADQAAILSSSTWKLTSRVAFLEVSCECSEGACTTGPYCMDSDKHATHQENVKGTVTVLKTLGTGETFTEANTNYASGRSKFKDDVHNDICVNSITVKEYKCATNGSEFLTEEIPCGVGNTCNGDKCVVPPVTQVVGTYTPECQTDADCKLGEKCNAPICESVASTALSEQELQNLRDELTKLELLINKLESRTITIPGTTGVSGITKVPGAGIVGTIKDITRAGLIAERFRSIFGIEPKLPPGPTPLPEPNANDLAKQGKTIPEMLNQNINPADALKARSDFLGNPKAAIGELATDAAKGNTDLTKSTEEIISFADKNNIAFTDTAKIIIESTNKENIDTTSIAQTISKAGVKEGVSNQDIAKGLGTTVGYDTTKQVMTTTIGASATGTALKQAGVTTATKATITNIKIMPPTGTQQISGIKSMTSGSPKM